MGVAERLDPALQIDHEFVESVAVHEHCATRRALPLLFSHGPNLPGPIRRDGQKPQPVGRQAQATTPIVSRMGGPLEGIRVLDLSQVVAGPLATQILAEQGAEVIKVEPIGGELTRVTGPDHIRGLYANCNRGKRCLAVDLATPDGVEIVLSLAERSDVVVQNFRPGVVERLGIDFDTVAARNPDVIYGSVSGFGADSPYSQRPVLDPVIQGLVGMVHGQISNDLPFPDLVRTLVADKATAHTVAQSVTAALLARERGAGGQHIELAMLDATLAWFWPDGMADLTHKLGDIVTNRPGDLYRLIDTLDGQVVYFIATRAQFEGMWKAIGRDDLLADEDFCNPGLLTRNRELPPRRRPRSSPASLR